MFAPPPFYLETGGGGAYVRVFTHPYHPTSKLLGFRIKKKLGKPLGFNFAIEMIGLAQFLVPAWGGGTRLAKLANRGGDHTVDQKMLRIAPWELICHGFWAASASAKS